MTKKQDALKVLKCVVKGQLLNRNHVYNLTSVNIILLGSGAEGDVWEIEDNNSLTNWVLKTCKEVPSYNEINFISSKECKDMAEMGIVPYYSAGCACNNIQYYKYGIIMSSAGNMSLNKYRKIHGSIPLNMFKEVVAKHMTFNAYTRSIHGDLHDGNIMLSVDNKKDFVEGSIRIIDFGFIYKNALPRHSITQNLHQISSYYVNALKNLKTKRQVQNKYKELIGSLFLIPNETIPPSRFSKTFPNNQERRHNISAVNELYRSINYRSLASTKYDDLKKIIKEYMCSKNTNYNNDFNKYIRKLNDHPFPEFAHWYLNQHKKGKIQLISLLNKANIFSNDLNNINLKEFKGHITGVINTFKSFMATYLHNTSEVKKKKLINKESRKQIRDNNTVNNRHENILYQSSNCTDEFRKKHSKKDPKDCEERIVEIFTFMFYFVQVSHYIYLANKIQISLHSELGKKSCFDILNPSLFDSVELGPMARNNLGNDVPKIREREKTKQWLMHTLKTKYNREYILKLFELQSDQTKTMEEIKNNKSVEFQYKGGDLSQTFRLPDWLFDNNNHNRTPNSNGGKRTNNNTVQNKRKMLKGSISNPNSNVNKNYRRGGKEGVGNQGRNRTHNTVQNKIKLFQGYIGERNNTVQNNRKMLKGSIKDRNKYRSKKG